MLPTFTDSQGTHFKFEIYNMGLWPRIKIKYERADRWGFLVADVVLGRLELLNSNHLVSQEAINFFERVWKNRAFL